MKRLLLCLLLPLMPCLASLAQTTEVLKLWTKEGEEIYFRLDKRPKITFGKGYLYVQTNEDEISFPQSTIRKCTIETTDVSGVSSVKAAPEVTYRNGVLTFSRLSANAAIQIYSLEGQLLYKAFADAEGNAKADLAREDKGIYIIKTPEITFKLKK